jgi:predicted nucleic acid-binding protein
MSASMTFRSFIDTNVLIYAEASDFPHKQRASLDLLKRLYEQGPGVVSTQVLQKYCNAALKKLKLPAHYVRSQLDLYEQFEVIWTEDMNGVELVNGVRISNPFASLGPV